METSFRILNNTREIFLNTIKVLSIEQLNFIPQGFNNNIIWNFGHVLVTQQILAYKLSGLGFNMPDELVNKYRNKTRPEEFITTEEYQQLNKFALSINNELEADYKKGQFSGFKPYQTSMGMNLDTIEAVISFLPVHEGMHIGYAMALKKFV